MSQQTLAERLQVVNRIEMRSRSGLDRIKPTETPVSDQGTQTNVTGVA